MKAAHPYQRRPFDGKCSECGRPRDAHASEAVRIVDPFDVAALTPDRLVTPERRLRA